MNYKFEYFSELQIKLEMWCVIFVFNNKLNNNRKLCVTKEMERSTSNKDGIFWITNSVNLKNVAI